MEPMMFEMLQAVAQGRQNFSFRNGMQNLIILLPRLRLVVGRNESPFFLLITMHFLFRQSNRTLTRTHCKAKYITKQNEISMSLVSDFDTSITRKSCNEPIRLRLELAVTVLSSIILYNYTSIQVIFSSDVAYHLMNSASQSSDFIVDFIYGSNQ